MPTIDNTRKNDNNKSKQYHKATVTFAMAILALTLAFSGMGSIINSAAAQTPQDNSTDDNLGQTTTPASVTDIESGRLSILGALGVSLVENVKVTAIALNENATEVTVTLSNKGNATAPSIISPNVSNETNSTAGTTATTPGVTVAAFKTKLDLTSLLQAHMMMGKSQSEMPPMTDSQGSMMTMQNHGQMGTMSGSGMPMFDIMSLIEKLEIGSNIENKGWTSPAEITVPVINGSAENDTSNITTTTSGTPDTDVIVVVVIPYTGENGAIDQNSTNLSQP